ncbi:MAG: hypothetical protein PUA62_08485 [Lachnospiraceae bacterium]|nr:hypothetical protein [Lachnospiraceae bacterium]
MKKKISGNKKHLTGSVAAVAMSVVACSAGTTARQSKEYIVETPKYNTDVTANEDEVQEVEPTENVSEEELVDKLTSSVNISAKEIDKDETVYVFADANGNTTDILVNEVLKNPEGKSVLNDKTNLTDIVNVKGDEAYTIDGDTITWQANGNDITYQGTCDKELPVNVKVTYTLDGKEIKPQDLAGKTGHVKIRFDYENETTVVKSINGRDEDIHVPFVAITGMVLGDNFTNISVTNGRSVAQGDSKVVVGFGMPGLMDSIKASNEDFTEAVNVPDYFEIEADVVDFSLDMTATVVVDGSAMNISGEIDLKEMDALMTELSNATTQLVTGSGDLSDGVATLLEKMGEFDTGIGKLKAGIDSLSANSNTLIDGIGTIDASAQSISIAITTLDTALNTPMSDELKQATYDTAYATASAAAGDAAGNMVASLMREGTDQYNAIKGQASQQFYGMLTDADTQAAAVTKVNTAITSDPEVAAQISQLATALTPGVYQQMLAAVAAQYGVDPSLLDDATKATVMEQAQTQASAIAQQTIISVASKTTTSVMNTIAAEYSDTIGSSVADACKEAAVKASSLAASQAAGQAAGQAAIQGAESAKSQIAAQIEAVQANGYSLVTGAKALAEGTSSMNNAVPSLSQGISALKDGATSLSQGSGLLLDGVSTLNEGATALKDGMQTYDTEAIGRIVGSYNGDIKSLVERLAAVASASAEYDIFTMKADDMNSTTKFIIKTEGIKATR